MSQMGGDWGWLGSETVSGTLEREGELTGHVRLCGTCPSSELGRVWGDGDMGPSTPELLYGRVIFFYHTPWDGLPPYHHNISCFLHQAFPHSLNRVDAITLLHSHYSL